MPSSADGDDDVSDTLNILTHILTAKAKRNVFKLLNTSTSKEFASTVRNNFGRRISYIVLLFFYGFLSFTASRL